MYSDGLVLRDDTLACWVMDLGKYFKNFMKIIRIDKYSHKVQDKFSANSFQKAATGNNAGKFKAEIIPITTKI